MFFMDSYKKEINRVNMLFAHAEWAKSLVLLSKAILDVAYEATESDQAVELKRLNHLYDLWELKIPEINKAFEEGFNVSRAGKLPKEVYYSYYSPLWNIKPTLCGLIWDVEDQIGL